MIVNITAEHLEEGVQGCGQQCPIALALMEQGFENVDVNPHSITTNRGSFPPTLKAKQFMRAFDAWDFPSSPQEIEVWKDVETTQKQ